MGVMVQNKLTPFTDHGVVSSSKPIKRHLLLTSVSIYVYWHNINIIA